MKTIEIDKTRVPSHIAVIMDGNGRWAKRRGENRVKGHEEGVKRVKDIIKASVEYGVKYLTLYTFSAENWNRPDYEINALMTLLSGGIRREIKEMHENGVRFNVIGDLSRFASGLQKELKGAMELTKDNTTLEVTLALGYGSRQEITNAIKAIAEDVAGGKVKSENINEELVSTYLYTKSMPEVDLVIRTSGEIRVSNFLLWQIAYSELYFTEVLWPDFGKEEYKKAILDYQSRERRFGKTSEQLK